MSDFTCHLCLQPKSKYEGTVRTTLAGEDFVCDDCVSVMVAYYAAKKDVVTAERLEALDDELFVRAGDEWSEAFVAQAGAELEKRRPGFLAGAVAKWLTAPLPLAPTAANFVSLTSHGSRMEAEAVVSLLRSCGVRAILNGGDLGGANPLLAEAFGIEVLVDMENLAEARAILGAAPATTAAAPRIAPPGWLYRVVQLLWLIFLASLAAAVLQTSGSERLANPLLGKIMAVAGAAAPAATLAYAWRRSRQARRRRREAP